MCGIAGIARSSRASINPTVLGRMAAAIRHRGPDGYGFYVGAHVGLAHVRLSIVDLAGGAQPLTNEDGEIVVTYNGEIYNHRELRLELEKHGHRFKTNCDTEVLVHGYEQWGPGVLRRLNGQFAFVIHDRRTDCLFLARDRFGVRPLFFAERGGDIYFASEMKAILASGEVDAVVDPQGLDETFTFWASRPPRTPLRGIASLEPGTYAEWHDGALRVHEYYQLDFPELDLEPRDALERLDELMRSGVALRMRADVPVGGYLSGGLDSSITCAVASLATPHDLRTFSVSFDDPQFDESPYQREAARSIGSQHHVSAIGASCIADVFPAVVWHAESPLLRTAPAPMYHLAKLARERGITVVLTGEGADELFLGYDLFKEVAIRRFCLRRPGSLGRQRLFDRLYPYLGDTGRAGDFWRRFFLDAGAVDDPLFSHLPRFLLTSRIKEFYDPAFRQRVAGTDAMAALRASLPERFFGWSPHNQAAYLEMTTLLSPYLLSAQGDRMAMAHGVEGRFPFLDHRLYEFAAALPTSSKLLGLKEKEILRRWARRILPAGIGQRRKQPYRAPDVPSFFANGAPSYVDELLAPAAVQKVGVFSPAAISGLVRRCRSGQATSVREGQALVAALSTQLWHQQFIENTVRPEPLDLARANVFLQDVAPIHS